MTPPGRIVSVALVVVAASACVDEAEPSSQDAVLDGLRARVDSLAAGSFCPRVFVAGEHRVYDRVEGEAGVVCRHAATGDTMVKVGAFWIDRYELTACPGGSVGADTGDDTTALGCSRAGVAPHLNVTWFQAAAMCVNAGKHLCTNAQWQTAVAGTVDPGASDGATGACVTMATQPRATGLGVMCRSRFGAEDMIGNVHEWVADWWVAGKRGPITDGEQAAPWPESFPVDRTYNVDGASASMGAWQRGLPAAPRRGGRWLNHTIASAETEAGAFVLDLTHGPSHHDERLVGARCCVGGGG